MTQRETKKQIRDAGMRSSYDSDTEEWRVAFPDNDEDSAYYTDDAEDAVNTARAMAEQGRTGNPLGNPLGNLPPKAARQWEHVYESAQKRGLSKSASAAQAWCAVKRGYYKKGNRWLVRKKKLGQDEYPPGCEPYRGKAANPEELGDAYVALRIGWDRIDVASVSIDNRMTQSTDAYMKMAAEKTGATIIDEHVRDVPTPGRDWGSMSFSALAQEEELDDLLVALKREAESIPWVSMILIGADGHWPEAPRVRQANPEVRKLKGKLLR